MIRRSRPVFGASSLVLALLALHGGTPRDAAAQEPVGEGSGSPGSPTAPRQFDSVAHALDAIVAASPQDRPVLQAILVAFGSGAVPDLIAALDATGDPLRFRTAVWALGEIASPSACDAVAPLLAAPSDDPGTRLAVASASARCGDIAPLRDLLAVPEVVIRLKAAILLGLLDDAASLPAITQMASDPALAQLLDYVSIARGLLRDASVRDALVPMLRTRELRLHAAIALGRMGERSVIFDLEFGLDSDEALLREMCLRALVESRAPNAQSALARMQSDPDPRISTFAERELRLWSHPH